MKTPAPPSRSLEDLRELTPARVGLGRAGASMPTDALLAFTLDHARARDAVHAPFDGARLIAELTGLGLQSVQVSSQARNRRDYLRRPDLGRMLDPASQRSWPVSAEARISLPSSSEMACRRRRSMPTRLNWFAISARG